MTRRRQAYISIAASLALAVVAAAWLRAADTKNEEASETTVDKSFVAGDVAQEAVDLVSDEAVDLYPVPSKERGMLTPKEAFDSRKKPYEGVQVVLTDDFKQKHPKFVNQIGAVKNAPQLRTDYFEKEMKSIPTDMVDVYRWDVFPIGEPHASPNGNMQVKIRVQPIVTGFHPATHLQLQFDEIWQLRNGRLEFVYGAAPKSSTGAVFGG